MIARTKLIILTMTVAAFSMMVATTTNIFLTESGFAAGGPPLRSTAPPAPTPAIATPPAPTPIIRNSTSGNATSVNAPSGKTTK